MSIKNGLNTELLENGMTLQTTYLNGLKSGSETYYYPNGQKASEGHYVNDKPEGIQTAWDENGQLESEQEYKNGELNGKSVFYENGIKTSEFVLKNGDIVRELNG